MIYDIIPSCLARTALIFIILALSALSFQRTGVYKNNFSLWMDVVKKSPLKARSISNLGLAYEANQMYENAYKSYFLAAGLYPAYAPAHSNLASIYYKKELFDEAEKELKLAIRLGPPFEDLHRRLGFVYMRKGLIDDAKREFVKGTALIPNHPDALRRASIVYANEGFSYTDRGDFKRAVLLHDTAISIYPVYPDAHYGAAMSYEAMKQKEEAILHWQEYLRLAPAGEPFRNDAMAHLKALQVQP
jgi:tetratricopeptide (TPR) repeat protein